MSRGGAFSKDCLVSIVLNSSGVKKKFGFLPPHGIELDAGETATVWGNVLEAVGRGDRATDRRHHQALADAIDRQDIEILSTPSSILQDAVSHDPKMFHLSGGTLTTLDPCWDTSDSLDVIVPG